MIVTLKDYERINLPYLEIYKNKMDIATIYIMLSVVLDRTRFVFNYPLANEAAKGYSNATVHPSILP